MCETLRNNSSLYFLGGPHINLVNYNMGSHYCDGKLRFLSVQKRRRLTYAMARDSITEDDMEKVIGQFTRTVGQKISCQIIMDKFELVIEESKKLTVRRKINKYVSERQACVIR